LQIRSFLRVVTVAAILISGVETINAEEPAQLSTALAMARAAKKVNPEYPAAARQLGISGTQDVAITVNEQGDVLDAKVTKGNAMFSNASIAAVKQWKFTPYVKDGTALKFSTTIMFTYAK
jgi:TonB family protein